MELYDHQEAGHRGRNRPRRVDRRRVVAVLLGDTPEAVDVEAANTQLDVDLAVATDDAPAAAPDPFDGDINATWVVDDEIGEFDFDTASGSFAGFRVDEELTVPYGDVVAVGRTGGVSGTVTIDGGRLTGTDITVDMGSITSNDARREFPCRAVMANEFPTATFVLTSRSTCPPVSPPARRSRSMPRVTSPLRAPPTRRRSRSTPSSATTGSVSSPVRPRSRGRTTASPRRTRDRRLDRRERHHRVSAHRRQGLRPRRHGLLRALPQLMAQPHVPTSLDQITAEVMTDALRSSGFDEVTVSSVSAERIAIGEGFLGELLV